MSLPLLILGLLLFVALVVVHEFGHFLAAKKNGVEVEEFGIGFPPQAKVLTEKNGTVYTLNWLPIGGFVKLKGEHDADTQPGTYGAAKLPTKVKILLAGVGMNLLVAVILLTALAWLGMPKIVDGQFTVKSDTKVSRNDVLIGYIETGSPAEKAGLQPRDQFIEVKSLDSCSEKEACSSDYVITTNDDLINATHALAGQKVAVTIKRDGQEKVVTTQLLGKAEVDASKNTDNPKGYLGISPTEYTLRRSTWSAPIVAVGLAGQFTELTFKGLGNAVAGLFQGDTAKASAQVSGPVGIFVVIKEGSLLGYQFILMIIAIISLTLAIMNSLPIPALDGGRLFVTLLYRGMHKPLKQRTEELIHGTGFAVLMLLFVLITFVDIKRFF